MTYATTFFSCRFSANYRGGWLPYKGYRGVTVAADYCGNVTVQYPEQTVVADYRGSVPKQMPCFLVCVPSKPWRPITAEA